MVPEGGALGGVTRAWVASRGDEETRALFLPHEDTVRSRQFATGRGFSPELDQANLCLPAGLWEQVSLVGKLLGLRHFAITAPAKAKTDQPQSQWATRVSGRAQCKKWREERGVRGEISGSPPGVL